LKFRETFFEVKWCVDRNHLPAMSGKGGILAELARRVELNRQKAIDSPLLRARWKKFQTVSGFSSPSTPKQRQKSAIPGALGEKRISKFNLSRASSDSSALYPTSVEQQLLEDIMHAIRENKHKKIKSILKDRRINVNTLNFLGVAPLHEACYYGNLKCVKALIDNGADVHFADSEGWTPLFAAVCGEHMPCVKLLIDNNAVVNCSDFFGVSPLRIAVTVRNLEMVNFLVKRGADMMTIADDGKTPFQIAVELSDDSILAYFLHNPSLHVANCS